MAGIQPDAILAAPVASTASTTPTAAQYVQPTVNPAHGPIAFSACTENAPPLGCSAAISPSMRRTSSARTPASPNEMSTAGPASAMPAPVPTNRPAPITPPSAIMVTCRSRR